MLQIALGSPLRMQLDYLRCYMALGSRSALQLGAGSGGDAAAAAVQQAGCVAEGYASDDSIDVVSGLGDDRVLIAGNDWWGLSWGKCSAHHPPPFRCSAFCS